MAKANPLIRILLVDDHQIIRDGIKALLAEENDIQIIAEADNGEQALSVLDKLHVDLVMLDINMPILNGIETTKIISKQYPAIQVLILTMHDDIEYIANALKYGAAGYILKDCSKKELIIAVHKTVIGENYFSKEVSFKMMKQFMSENATSPETTQKTDKQPTKSESHLTKREIEIIKMIAEEFTNTKIADKLCISPRTVDTHRRNLLQKLGVRNTAGLIGYVLRNGIIH